jgi:hypothetical protein
LLNSGRLSGGRPHNTVTKEIGDVLADEKTIIQSKKGSQMEVRPLAACDVRREL